MTYTTLKLCSGRASFEAVPRPRLSLNLAEVAERLRAKGIPVTDARVMLLVEWETPITLSQDGRVLVKTGDPLIAQQQFERFREVAGLPDGPPAPSVTSRVPERVIPP